MADIVLVLGGVRSGKSRFAQQLAERAGGDVLFVATAEARDQEMADRIAHHQASRPAHWKTLEATSGLADAVSRTPVPPPTVLIDCITILVSNVLLQDGNAPPQDVAQQHVSREIDALLAACRQWSGTVIMVSGEVGMGVVPESRLGRLYRDLLGWSNQAIAAAASEVYLLVAGIPVELKKLAAAEQANV